MIKLYNGAAVSMPVFAANGGRTNLMQNLSTQPESNSPGSTYFLLGDHFGTAQMEFGQGGWPCGRLSARN